MRRVVVTGMGMVTPLGRDLESTWSALLAGKSGVGPITLFDARTFPTRIAAEVQGFSARRLHRRRRALGRALAQQQVRPGGRVDGDEGLGPAGLQARARTGGGSASTWARAKASRTFPGSSSLVHRSTHDGRVDTAEFTRLGVQGAPPDPRSRAGARNARPATWRASSAPGARTPTA